MGKIFSNTWVIAVVAAVIVFVVLAQAKKNNMNPGGILG